MPSDLLGDRLVTDGSKCVHLEEVDYNSDLAFAQLLALSFLSAPHRPLVLRETFLCRFFYLFLCVPIILFQSVS